MEQLNQIRNKVLVLFAFFFFLGVFNGYSDNSTRKEWVRKELSEKAKRHLCCLADIYGYVRYFYPNDNLKDLNWFNFLIYSIKEVEDYDSEKDFDQKLYDLFSPLCPQIQINNSLSKPSCYSSGSFYIQEHRCGESGKMNFISEIKKISEYSSEYPKPDSLYTFNINSDLTVSFPISLSKLPASNKNLTAIIKKSNEKILDEKSLYNLFASEPYARIANEIIRCNIVQHFYPYYFEDGLDVTWEKSYKDYFNKIADCENSTSYYYLVCNRMNLVKDSHINLTFNILRAYSMNRVSQIETVILDNKMFVKGVSAPYEKEINPGDRIIKVNNDNTESFIKEKLKYLSYSTLPSGLTKLTSSGEIFKSYKRDSVINLTIKNAEGKESEVHIRADSYRPFNIEDKEFVKCLDGSIYYVNFKDPNLSNYDKFKNYISEINKSKGAIFDLRGYPNESLLSVLANITDTVLSMGNLNNVYYYFPNHIKTILKPVEKFFIAPSTSTMSKDYSKKNEYPLPSNDKITAPCVFLINSTSISYMESIVDMIKSYNLGILVGENTAGCNGDVVHFDLPFASFMISGMKYLNRDGTQHHGIGIAPNIYVENKDINKDSQLEAAKRYLNELASHNRK